MSPDDLDYHRRRAATEREMARASERADVAAIHEILADQYEALLHNEELRPGLAVLQPKPPSVRQERMRSSSR